jgi:dTDP-4-dehydrorhamnose 3,5-epimerase
MIFHETTLKDAWLIDMEPRTDSRGFFTRLMCRDEMGELGMVTEYVQQNLSITERRGTVRGLHYQVHPYTEAKLARCAVGALCDVIVDLRKDSPTYMQHEAFELTEHNFRQLYMPPGFAHAMLALTDNVQLTYLVSAVYTAGSERGIRYDDPRLAINWPIPVTEVSDKDISWPFLTDENLPAL